jgi:hypothetical protein
MERPVQDKEARPYAVNDKQYVAVLVGSRQPNNIIPQAPELENTIDGVDAVRLRAVTGWRWAEFSFFAVCRVAFPSTEWTSR